MDRDTFAYQIGHTADAIGMGAFIFASLLLMQPIPLYHKIAYAVYIFLCVPLFTVSLIATTMRMRDYREQIRILERWQSNLEDAHLERLNIK